MVFLLSAFSVYSDTTGITGASQLLFFGVVAGLLGTVLLGRLLNSLLFEVSSRDPLTYLAGATLIAAVSLLACLLPARSATHVDPMLALRYE
jgi:ABC-type antimicrobial peptide transport system permease subunit